MLHYVWCKSSDIHWPNKHRLGWLERKCSRRSYWRPNDLDSSERQNAEVISKDEDHDDKVRSKLITLQALQHLDELLEFSIANNDETLSGLSEMINAVENIKISSIRQSNIPSFFSRSLKQYFVFFFTFVFLRYMM